MVLDTIETRVEKKLRQIRIDDIPRPTGPVIRRECAAWNSARPRMHAPEPVEHQKGRRPARKGKDCERGEKKEERSLGIKIE